MAPAERPRYGGGIRSLVVFQQQLRSAANHPQVEMAREAAGNLNAGAKPQTLVNGTPIDIASSTAAYLIVVDSNGAMLASSAQLEGREVIPPPVYSLMFATMART